MFQKIKHKYTRLSKNQKRFWFQLFVGIVLVFLVAFVTWFWMHTRKAVAPAVSAPLSTVVDPLTGKNLDHVTPNAQVYGVMIDEHVDARPQSGIDQAFLVIEAPVEAGIPRLLAFFSQDEKVDKIGPVRSARPYYVDWALEFGALYAHVGGSNEALEKIKNGATFDLNQFWHDQQFWRDSHRSAPHNVYTSTDLLGAYVQQKQDAGRPSSLYGVWKYKTTEPTEVFPERFTIDYVSPDYVFSWGYDVQKKAYVRLFDDQPVKTLEGNEIRVQNVAVVISTIEIIDSAGRRRVQTTGEGAASVFQDGKKIKATWKKPTEGERLRFYGSDGKELEMNPGKTWIEVIADESQLTISP